MTHAQLKAFHAVAQSAGFSRAAEKLSLTQPAVSDHIAKLELTCGTQLFVRTRREAVLTEFGRRLFALTERLFETEGQIEELISRARKLEEGSLAIGADAAVHVLPLISSFRERYPGVAVKLIGGNSAALLERVDRFEIDFAVVSIQPAEARYEMLLLREDRLVALISKQAPVRLKSLEMASLATCPVVLREEGSMTRTLLLDEMARRKLKLSNVTEIDSREAVSEAVAQGLGIGIVSESEVVPDTRLRQIPFADWAVTMREWLVWLGARTDLKLVAAFLDIARRQKVVRNDRNERREAR
ncbi:MAG: LysR family transcriptional regulator [Rhizobiales bacterium]|nr:LysR family transcriptional regulator [Hyphomicrobiales bacterium]